MSRITAKLNLDPLSDSATVTLEPVADTALEHELLLELFQSHAIGMVAEHKGDILSVRFTVTNTGAFLRAQRAVENRMRIRQGLKPLPQPESSIPDAT
jgi:hypothetical protein